MSKGNSELFRIFKDDNNFSILKNLDEKDISKLSSKTKLDDNLVRKILKSFEKSLIIKKQGNSFVLTELGSQTLRKTQGLEFLYSHMYYFLSHSIEEIPQSLIQRVEAFSNCNILESIWPVSTKLVDTAKKSEKFVSCIFSEPPFLLADPLFDKIHSGIRLRMLFGKNSNLPDCNDLVDKLELNKPKSDSLFLKRICENVITNLLVSDKGACLMLGTKNNETDMVNAIIGNDEQFIEWCNDFFEYKWNQGEKFARLRTLS